MDLVASAQANRGLAFGGMESALGIEFHVPFEAGGEIVADNKTTEPAVRSFVDELITDFVIHPDGAESPGEFEGQEESIARRSDAPADRIVRVVDKELGENRDVEAGLSGVVETPFDAEIRLAQTKLSRGRRILDAQPSVFVSELDAIAHSEIDVKVRRVGDRLMAVEEGHVSKIDFPIEIAGRARIIRVERRPALGKCGGSCEKEHEAKDWTSQHSYGAKGGRQNGYEGNKWTPNCTLFERTQKKFIPQRPSLKVPPRMVGADSILVHPDSRCSAGENQWQWHPRGLRGASTLHLEGAVQGKHDAADVSELFWA